MVRFLFLFHVVSSAWCAVRWFNRWHVNSLSGRCETANDPAYGADEAVNGEAECKGDGETLLRQMLGACPLKPVAGPPAGRSSY